MPTFLHSTGSKSSASVLNLVLDLQMLLQASWEIHGNPWKSMEIHGNPWKSMEIHGNPWKSSNLRYLSLRCRSQSSFIPHWEIPVISPSSWMDFTKPQLPWSWDWWPNTWAKVERFKARVENHGWKPISKEKSTKLLPSPRDSVEELSHSFEWNSL